MAGGHGVGTVTGYVDEVRRDACAANQGTITITAARSGTQRTVGRRRALRRSRRPLFREFLGQSDRPALPLRRRPPASSTSFRYTDVPRSPRWRRSPRPVSSPEKMPFSPTMTPRSTEVSARWRRPTSAASTATSGRCQRPPRRRGRWRPCARRALAAPRTALAPSPVSGILAAPHPVGLHERDVLVLPATVVSTTAASSARFDPGRSNRRSRDLGIGGDGVDRGRAVSVGDEAVRAASTIASRVARARALRRGDR